MDSPPRIIALLSFYDEPLEQLAHCARGLVLSRTDHLVAVDGAYALYPGAKASSHPDQRGLLDALARGGGMGLSMYVPTVPWPGNEPEKRTFLFAAGLVVARPGVDWFFVVDADEEVLAWDGVVEALAATDRDAAVVAARDDTPGLTQTEGEARFPTRKFFRAQRITVETHHAHYVGEGGVTLWNSGLSKPRAVEPLDLTDRVLVSHRPHRRPAERINAKAGYYAARDEVGAEFGACDECTVKQATQRVHCRWRVVDGHRLHGDVKLLCDACADSRRRRDAILLRARGIDPAAVESSERYRGMAQRLEA